MLNGIPSIFSPELLIALYRMGHGDEIVLADGHFPGHGLNTNVIRADGLLVPELLRAILKLMPLDTYVESPVVMMAPVEGDTLVPAVEEEYRRAIEPFVSTMPSISRIDRFDFYDRAKHAFAVVMTSETRSYGNILLKKGHVTASSI